MYQLEPVLGTTATSYLYPPPTDPAIPDGIVQKCRQIFVSKYSDDERLAKSRSGMLNIFETPTTSCDELNSLNKKYYPITRVTPDESFKSPPSLRRNNENGLSAKFRVLPPPSYAEFIDVRNDKNDDKSSFHRKQPDHFDFVSFGVNSSSEFIRDGPIWINSGPPISSSHQVHFSKLWRRSNDSSLSLTQPPPPQQQSSPPRKRHVITRFDRNMPALTINVSSKMTTKTGKENMKNLATPLKGEKTTKQILTTSEADGWSCRTDWKYYESSSPRISDVVRIEKMDREQQRNKKHRNQMGVDMNERKNNHILDNVSLGSSRRTSDDHESIASDSSQIMSMHEQIVRYSVNQTTPSFNSQSTEEAIMNERETTLVVRLERELTEAQNCNHRLNQQLKTLANSSNSLIKKELTDTKKQLKDRINEVEQLRKQLAKSESERSMWLSKQPQDVSTLQAEKQELRKQLDREQSEKQELFMQINSMIAQLADAGDQNEVIKLKAEVSNIKKELDAEKNSSSNESSRLQSELLRLQRELETIHRNGDKEKENMENEIEELQRQLDIKSASIQSLMLAKSDTSKIDRVVEENERLKSDADELRKKLANLANEVVEKQSEIMKLRDAGSVNEVMKQKLDEVQTRLVGVEKQYTEEQLQKERLRAQTEDLKNALSSSEDVLSRLKNKIAQFEQDATFMKEENARLNQINMDSSRANDSQLNDLARQLKEEQSKNSILEATLSDKDGKIDKVKINLLSAESRAQQAESDLKAMETRAQNSERKERQLEAQLSANGDSNEQLELVRNDLTKSEERYQLVQARLQKVEAQLKEKETESRQRSDSLESALVETNNLQQQLEQLRREKQDVSSSNDDIIYKLKSEIAQFQTKSANNEETIRKLNITIDDLSAERKKLESKASVADEINTLMTSLNSVRQENSNYEEECRSLENELRSLREELYNTQDECSNWKSRAEKAETEMEHQVQKVEHLQTAQESHSARLEAENKRLEELLKKEEFERENTRSDQFSEVLRVRSEMTEAAIISERTIGELKEKLVSVQRELEMTKKRVEQLQDDQCSFIGTQDEMRAELLKQVQEYQDNSEQLSIEIESLKSQNMKLSSELKEVTHLNEDLNQKLEKVEKKYDETNDELHNAEEQLHLLKEAQILSGSNNSSKIQDLQEENKRYIEKLTSDHKTEVGEVREELKKINMERSSLEAVIEDQQKELIKHREDTDALQDQLRSNGKEKSQLEQEIRELKLEVTKSGGNARKLEELEEKLSEANRTNQGLISNVQEMTKLLQSETKRLEEVSQEKKRLEEEAENVKVGSSNDAKVDELVVENSRLAAELLKSRSAVERTLQTEREQISRQFEERLKNVNLEKTRLASELQATQSKIEEQKQNMEAIEKRRRADIQQLEYVRDESAQLRSDIEKLQANGPIAPPRSTRTISNMSAMTNWTQADFSECEDFVKLRQEIDKQKRLIIVLRRKLQGLTQH